MFIFGQSRNPMKLVFDHHTITNKPHNIQIRSSVAPRCKITKVRGNLPLVAQFRVLCRPGLLTVQHSLLSLFPFPLFLFFLPPFSSLFFFPFLFFPPFLSSFFLPFLFSLPSFLHSLPPFSYTTPHELNWNPTYIGFKSDMHVDTWHAMCHTHGYMACHVSHMHAFAMHCDTWISMCHSHGFPCVTNIVRHVSSTWLAMCRPTPLPRNT